MTRSIVMYLIGALLGVALLAAVKTCNAANYSTLDFYPGNISAEEVRSLWAKEITPQTIQLRPAGGWVFISLTDAALNDTGTCHYFALATTEQVRGGALPFEGQNVRFSTLGHEFDSTTESCRSRMMDALRNSMRRLVMHLDQSTVPVGQANQ